MDFAGFDPRPVSPTPQWAAPGPFCGSPALSPQQPRLVRALSDCSNAGRPPRSPSPLAAALSALSPLPSPGKAGYAIPRPRLYPQAALEGSHLPASPAPSAWCVGAVRGRVCSGALANRVATAGPIFASVHALSRRVPARLSDLPTPSSASRDSAWDSPWSSNTSLDEEGAASCDEAPTPWSPGLDTRRAALARSPSLAGARGAALLTLAQRLDGAAP